MDIFSIGLAFSAVELPCREMNNMGFGLAFWEAHPPHTKPISLIYFCQLRSSTSGTCSHIFPPHTSPLLHLFPRLLLPILVSICAVWACLHGQRKRGERASLNNTYKQYNASTQWGPSRCLPSRFTAFVSFASLYMHFLYLQLLYCRSFFSVV